MLRHIEAAMSTSSKTCAVVDLGRISYAAAYLLQQRAVAARKAGVIGDLLLLCEHTHVITLGRNGKREHLRANDRLLAQMDVEFCESDRGGDITYHGPGQIVGYPILDLTEHRRDVRWYVEMLEEAMIRSSAEFGISARRVEGRHGLWVDTDSGEEEKLAAIGVHLSRWVTSHGFAYNVSTDLRYFDLIVPCGIPGKRATSLERLLKRAVGLERVKSRVSAHFADVFERKMIPMSHSELVAAISTGAPIENGLCAGLGQMESSVAGVTSGD
jgi:lipoyl(octanoyl) transferase